jgi:hypothetical protein
VLLLGLPRRQTDRQTDRQTPQTFRLRIRNLKAAGCKTDWTNPIFLSRCRE